MADFRRAARISPNLENSITLQPFGVRSSNFQDFLLFVMPTTGENFKEI